MGFFAAKEINRFLTFVELADQLNQGIKTIYESAEYISKDPHEQDLSCHGAKLLGKKRTVWLQIMTTPRQRDAVKAMSPVTEVEGADVRT